MLTGSSSAEEYDPQHTMLALNMAIVSIHKIANTQDRIVLDQEYNTIINKLALGNIEDDYEIKALYTELMTFITGRLLRNEEAQRFRERYNRREQRQVIDSLSGVRAYGGSLWSWLGSLAVSCVSQYFDYQNSKAELLEGLDDELWQLRKEDIEDCNELQVKLLDSSWTLLRKYNLPDEYRLTQDKLGIFFRAVNESDPSKRLRMLRVRNVERNFQVYPPYWFYRARAAQDSGNDEEASKCYEKFNEVWRPVLREDPYKLEAAKYRVRELVRNGAPSAEVTKEIKNQLEVVRNNLQDGDWSNNLFVGVAYFALGEKDEGINCVEANVMFEFEREISGKILSQMERGKLNPEALPEELRGLAEDIGKREEFVRKAQDRDLVFALTDLFEGHVDSAQSTLERLSGNSNNPVVFHALRLIEETRKSKQLDYAKIWKIQLKEYALSAESTAQYKAVLPIVEHYAEKGSEFAQLLLGDMYQSGLGVELMNTRALELFSGPAKKGNAYAQLSMGAVYNTLNEISNALKWYREAADQNNASAQNVLGFAYNWGIGVEQDPKKAAEWYQKAADQGYVLAQGTMGNFYRDGIGVEQNLKKAVEWYRKAADQGQPFSQNSLGDAYYWGIGVEQDYKKAFEWWRKSADSGYIEAQANLGFAYREGIGVEKDYKKALQWYQKAAEQGNADAQVSLGIMYREGEGVAQDYNKAVELFRRAAEQGYALGQCALGLMYDMGYGVTKDDKEAVKWYLKAAEQGLPVAQFNLGFMYENGYGVEKNLNTAREWYKKAAEQGHEDAREALERLR